MSIGRLLATIAVATCLASAAHAQAPPVPPANGGTGSNLSATGGAHQFLEQSTSGANISPAQPACGDLSNSATSCSTDATNANNITSGVLATAQDSKLSRSNATFIIRRFMGGM